MVYTPWSTGESYTPTSDILIDTSTSGSAAYTEVVSENNQSNDQEEQGEGLGEELGMVPGSSPDSL